MIVNSLLDNKKAIPDAQIKEEIKILLSALSYSEDEAILEIHKNTKPNIRWAEIIELARLHGVASLLHNKLTRLDFDLPGEITEELRQEHLKQSFRNIFLFQEMDKLLELFQDRGIKVIVLKGAYLARAVYDNIGLRGMSDIDLLVKREDLLRVEEAVSQLNGEPEQHNRIITDSSAHFGYKLSKQGIRVEIHWSLVSANMPFLIDVEGLWLRAQPFSQLQAKALTLSPEDLLIHLCLHIAKHTYNMQIRMLCDIGETVRHYKEEINWEVLIERARIWGVARALYIFLWLARDLLEADVPLELLNMIKPIDFDAHYLELVRQQLFKDKSDLIIDDASRIIARLKKQKGLVNQLSLIRDRVLLSREEMALMYPVPADSWRIYLYYFLRMQLFLKRYSKSLLKFARGDLKINEAADRAYDFDNFRDWLISG